MIGVRLAIVGLAAALLGAGSPDAAVPAAEPTATASSAAPSLEEQQLRRAEEERLRALAKEYEALAGTGSMLEPRQETAEPTRERSLAGAFLQMILVLGAVCLLAYLLLGKVLPRLLKIDPPAAPHRIMQVVDRMPLDQRRSIMIIRIGDGYYLVGASEGGISLLSRLDANDVAQALSQPKSPPLGKFGSMLLGRSEKS